MDRYQRNMNALSPEENQSLKNFHVVVVGCGGLGGYIIEMLARLGIGTLTVIDGDKPEPTAAFLGAEYRNTKSAGSR
jgi:tRNA A37 threonylcarbamoyladenosine dehydratase